MNEDDIGKVFLVAVPWDWTIVGRFRGFVGGMMVFDEAGYFTRAGAPFNALCEKGFVLSGDAKTLFNFYGDGLRIRADANLILPWKTTWPQQARAR